MQRFVGVNKGQNQWEDACMMALVDSGANRSCCCVEVESIYECGIGMEIWLYDSRIYYYVRHIHQLDYVDIRALVECEYNVQEGSVDDSRYVSGVGNLENGACCQELLLIRQ